MARYKTWLPRLHGGIGPTATAVPLSDAETELLRLLQDDAGQRRARVVVDGVLTQVARSRAQDMCQRNYFAHTNPDGDGPNTLVRAAGYVLPSHYSTAQDANSVESIALGYPTAADVWAGWLASEHHRQHVLGESDFFAEQVCVGVGCWHDAESEGVWYWALISAPMETV